MDRLILKMVIDAGLYKAGKIPMIKFVRTLTGLGLYEAKQMVDNLNLDFPAFTLAEQQELVKAGKRIK